jgi:anhydro-N-acetylmuramic acid kinase
LHPGFDELARAATLANELARSYAQAVSALLGSAKIESRSIRAIGCHGQTIRHEPRSGYTLQLVNGALLVELCGISVACDFRSRDIAAGGQGAPLVPAFHAAGFHNRERNRAIVNLGGIANVTYLAADGRLPASIAVPAAFSTSGSIIGVA